jgi:alcohol dehydrogenase (cytochrome c)
LRFSLSSLRGKRLAVWLVLAVAGVLVALLATGVFSRSTGGNNAATPTTPPTVVTTPEGQSSAAPTPFGPNDWGTYGGTFDQNRHSPLTEITKQNVNQLGRAFSIDLRRLDPTIPKGQQSFPLAIDGRIYVTTAGDHVFAVDGSSGKVLWHFKPSDTGIFKNFGVNANRGVAYCDGKLFLLTLDMRIVSLDPHTGGLIKQVEISAAVPGAKVEFGYSETQAPICYKNMLLFGASGSDYGVRGFVMAYKPDLTPAWPNPFWTIPPEGQAWRRGGRYTGGGTNWNPVTIDSETDTVYATTSNPSPIFDASLRPGSDPETDSIVALDLLTGKQKWWQQQIAGDEWGYSTSQPVLVYDVTIGGKKRRVVSVGTKEGTWFMYDARTGAPIYTRVRLLNHIEHPTLRAGHAVVVYPSSLGGLNYSPSSFDPGTGYVINSQAETASVLIQKKNVAAANKYKGLGDVDNGLKNSSFGQTPHGWRDYGSVSAVDAARGTVAWKFITPEPGRGGVTTTASGLGLAGGGDGALRAFDTKTGNVLWTFQTGYQLAAGPSIYAIKGKEYIAVTVGGTPTSSFGGTASRLDVFTLNGDTRQSIAPPLRPPGLGPGVILAPVAYLSLGADARTLELQVVASLDRKLGAPTLNGTANGAMTVRIPKGWRLNVTFANHSTVNPDGIAVTSSPHATSGVVPASGVAYFPFTGSNEGSFQLASTFPGRATAGEWMHLDVGPSNSLPELLVNGQTFELGVAGRSG